MKTVLKHRCVLHRQIVAKINWVYVILEEDSSILSVCEIQKEAGAFLSSSESSRSFHNLKLRAWDLLSFALPFSSQARQCSAGSSQFSKRSYPSLLEKYWVLTDEWKINHKRAVHSVREEWHRQNPAWKLILCLPVQYVVCREHCSPMILVPPRYEAPSLYFLQQRCPVYKKEILKVKRCYYYLKFKFVCRLDFLFATN